MALRLRSQGITRIRPLAEGLDGWRKRGFPLQQPEGKQALAQPAGA
jgi:rhodanese-related sulfurtransferase